MRLQASYGSIPFCETLCLKPMLKIRSLFGAEPRLLLQILEDPDDETEQQQLGLVIETSADRHSARTMLRKLDEQWWIEAMPKAANLMTISLEYR